MVHIYTGDGKGKTTAAVGVVIRALGAKKRVIFFQFMKAWQTNEIKILENLGVIVDRSWDGSFIKNKPSIKQIKMVQNQYKRVLKAFDMDFDIIVADEIIVAALFSLLDEKDILYLMKNAPKDKEIILTGCGATQKMIKNADLVTNMQKIKHYYDLGLNAREGIEY